MVKEKLMYYMFFEVLNRFTSKGSIGLAISKDGIHWNYDQIILDEEYHLSYPYVFEYENNYYMIPECSESGFVKLYKAINFPYKWKCVSNLIQGCFADASIFKYRNRFYMFTEKKDEHGNRNCSLHLYYSDKLETGWKEHCKSPIVTNDYIAARPAGRVFIKNDKLYRFAQNDVSYYGEGVSVFEITCLTEQDYKVKKMDMYLKGSNKIGTWNEAGMHHIDIFEDYTNKMIACMDGHYFKEYFTYIFAFKRKLYRLLSSKGKILTSCLGNLPLK